jgi:hypothetical protein
MKIFLGDVALHAHPFCVKSSNLVGHLENKHAHPRESDGDDYAVTSGNFKSLPRNQELRCRDLLSPEKQRHSEALMLSDACLPWRLKEACICHFDGVFFIVNNPSV